MPQLCRFALPLLALAVWPFDARAQVPSSTECLSAFEEAQLSRRDGHYLKARAFAKTCSHSACHPAVSRECIGWVAELEEIIPSVVLGARSLKGEESSVQVLLQGKVVADRIDGRPLELDPGSYTFEFTAEGSPSVTIPILLKAGEKLRSVTAEFRLPPPATPPTPSPPPPRTLHVVERPVPLSAYIAGGVGVAGLGAFAALAASAAASKRSMESGCAPFCQHARIDSARNRYYLADACLGVGVVSLGVATYLWLTRPSFTREIPASSPPTQISLSPGSDGASMVLSTAF